MTAHFRSLGLHYSLKLLLEMSVRLGLYYRTTQLVSAVLGLSKSSTVLTGAGRRRGAVG